MTAILWRLLLLCFVVLSCVANEVVKTNSISQASSNAYIKRKLLEKDAAAADSATGDSGAMKAGDEDGAKQEETPKKKGKKKAKAEEQQDPAQEGKKSESGKAGPGQDAEGGKEEEAAKKKKKQATHKAAASEEEEDSSGEEEAAAKPAKKKDGMDGGKEKEPGDGKEKASEKATEKAAAKSEKKEGGAKKVDGTAAAAPATATEAAKAEAASDTQAAAGAGHKAPTDIKDACKNDFIRICKKGKSLKDDEESGLPAACVDDWTTLCRGKAGKGKKEGKKKAGGTSDADLTCLRGHLSQLSKECADALPAAGGNNACKDDIGKLCEKAKDEAKDGKIGEAIRSCLQSHLTELSPACKAQTEERTGSKDTKDAKEAKETKRALETGEDVKKCFDNAKQDMSPKCARFLESGSVTIDQYASLIDKVGSLADQIAAAQGINTGGAGAAADDEDDGSSSGSYGTYIAGVLALLAMGGCVFALKKVLPAKLGYTTLTQVEATDNVPNSPSTAGPAEESAFPKPDLEAGGETAVKPKRKREPKKPLKAAKFSVAAEEDEDEDDEDVDLEAEKDNLMEGEDAVELAEEDKE